MLPRMLSVLLLVPVLAGSSSAEETPEPRVVLAWPTENRALSEGRPQDYFQTTISNRAVSGMYGFVRSNLPEPPPYLERFHEGIDIRPARRDAANRPLDPVRAAAPGKVVYTNTVASRSNFGLYVVIEHTYGPYKAYTTYGHMAKISVECGKRVAAGDEIGIVGHTGNVDNLEKSHLHFEFGFMLNDAFSSWYDKNAEKAEGKNPHGIYNGNNLFGVDPARLLMESQQGKAPTIREIFAREKTIFRVRVPLDAGLTYWQKQFPFMTRGWEKGKKQTAWEVDVNRIGIPLGFRPSDVETSSPELVWFDDSLSLQNSFTRGLVEKDRKSGKRRLSKYGLKWATLLTWKAE